MNMYIPKQRIWKVLLIYLLNIPVEITNLVFYIIRPFLFYAYRNIEKIEFYSFDIVDEECEHIAITCNHNLVDKYTRIVPEEEFNIIIKTIKRFRLFSWKRFYRAYYDYYDGGEWELKIILKNQKCFKVSGDVCGPNNLNKVVEAIETYFKPEERYYEAY